MGEQASVSRERYFKGKNGGAGFFLNKIGI
jgi:hypothetical protein